ncbi:MAG: tripartite tricarboxylate transporter permease [Candidatus Aenigmarchaeota archaeon]|nr:tripartite tricarboxylate transporter permease [Candidatus Aenigmarchaeota archaeon]
MEFLLAILLGILIGTLTGLIPGLHVNMIAAFVMSISIGTINDPIIIGCFLISLAITHSFVDFIPSIYLGAPDSTTALAVLPGHKYLLKGLGHMAVFLSVAGGISSIILLLILSPLLFLILPKLYATIKYFIPLILVLIVIYMIFLEKNKKEALIITILSGVLGILSFNTILREEYIFTALLGGLFGLSTIATAFAFNAKIPKQYLRTKITRKDFISGGFLGFAAGIVAGMLPGIGSSQSAILLNKLTNKKGARKYIISLGAINTTAAILSVIAIYLIGRARSGIAVAINYITEPITIETITLFLCISVISASLAAIITLKLSKKATTYITPKRYTKINIFVFLFVLSSIILLSGFTGLIIAISGMFLGIYAQISHVKKSLLLNALVIPIILYFFGIHIII